MRVRDVQSQGIKPLLGTYWSVNNGFSCRVIFFTARIFLPLNYLMEVSIPETTYQVIIIGAGAAGLMAAISALSAGGRRILLLDASENPGGKIRMSGGGRCNITNSSLDLNQYRGESVHAIKKVILGFPPEKVMAFFESAGVRTKIETPWNKVFPVSDSAETVLKALLRGLKREEITFRFPEKVEAFFMEEAGWVVRTNRGRYCSKSVLLAPGGFSYPHTGSDGKLWGCLSQLGITIQQPKPALTPLKTRESDLHDLAGLTVWVKTTIREKGKIVFSEKNSLLLTHDGFSGPAAMNVSEWFSVSAPDQATLEIQWIPDQNETGIRNWLLGEIAASPSKKMPSVLKTVLPERLAMVFCRMAGFGEVSLNQIGKPRLSGLIKLLTAFTPDITGTGGFKKAEVTSGGIRFSELNLSTLEVSRFPGLFAAGEIINVHGIIGGYNFQWAWSSGWLAGLSSIKRSQNGGSELQRRKIDS